MEQCNLIIYDHEIGAYVLPIEIRVRLGEQEFAYKYTLDKDMITKCLVPASVVVDNVFGPVRCKVVDFLSEAFRDMRETPEEKTARIFAEMLADKTGRRRE